MGIRIEPLSLMHWPAPFDHPKWLFEVKLDGFRALAYIESGTARLVSRNAHTYASFASLCAEIAATVPAGDAILDGEIVCLDGDGRPQFNELLFRRGEPCFYAFDLLSLDGDDLRDRPLLERKRLLRRILRSCRGRVRYLDHVVGRGPELFQAARERDLEGVVAKPIGSAYRLKGDRSPWLKIKNRDYRHARNRHGLFARWRLKRAVKEATTGASPIPSRSTRRSR